MNSTSIEAFTACGMIPLNKNPEPRPIGVGEVLHRKSGKVIMRVAKEDVINSVGSLQVRPKVWLFSKSGEIVLVSQTTIPI